MFISKRSFSFLGRATTVTNRAPAHTDVLIVGAGPAGLISAVTLAQLGIEYLIIDAKPAVAPGSKAAAIQPRTLEYLDRIERADCLIEDGLRGSGFAAADGDWPLLLLSYTGIASQYPFPLQTQWQAAGSTPASQHLADCRGH
jgi:2-polyprenyl-6-methoxyphenol hydroxylase-like FAD-dependent oxidoreductase